MSRHPSEEPEIVVERSRSDRFQARLLRHPRVYRVVRRAWHLARYLLRRPHSPQFAAFALFPERTGLFLDVGANDGTSAMSFRIYNRRSPILSIEANPENRRALRRVGLLVRNASFRIMAAGATPGRAKLRIPYYRGIPLTALSSLDEDSQQTTLQYFAARFTDDTDLSRITYRTIDVAVTPLDTLGLSPDFLKIDVEGTELEVITGLRATIARCRPVIMTEVNETIGATRELLEDLGYTAMRFDSQEGRMVPEEAITGSTLFFVPKEGDRTPG